MTCKYLGDTVGRYDCNCQRDEKDIAVRRCTHPDGLVQLAIEIAPGRGLVERLRVRLDGGEGVESLSIARCQVCSLNTDPPKPRARPKPPSPQVVQAVPQPPEPARPQQVAGRRTWVDPSRIRRSEKST